MNTWNSHKEEYRIFFKTRFSKVLRTVLLIITLVLFALFSFLSINDYIPHKNSYIAVIMVSSFFLNSLIHNIAFYVKNKRINRVLLLDIGGQLILMVIAWYVFFMS